MAKRKSSRSRQRRGTPDREARQNTSLGRGKYGVARALREIKQQMPDLLYVKPSERKALGLTQTKTQAPEPVAQKRVAPTSPDKKTRTGKKPLALSDKKECKSKPARNTGNGNSRAYVPWCK